MNPIRSDYDRLFQQHLRTSMALEPLFQLMTGPVADLESRGFFEFLRDHHSTPKINCRNTLSVVLAQIQADDPALASYILETEVGVIGLKTTAILASRLGIEVNVKHLYEHLGQWVERLEALQGMSLTHTEISTTEFRGITEDSRLLPLYVDLIFDATTPIQQEVVNRLFRMAPLNPSEINALTFHVKYKREALQNCAAEHEPNDYRKITCTAVHLGLGFSLREGHERGYRDYRENHLYTGSCDALLAQFLNPTHRDGAKDQIGKALMFSNIYSLEALSLVHGRLVDYLDTLGSDTARSAWLTRLACQMPVDFNNVDEQAKVNVAMGTLAIRLMADFADIDPAPLRTHLHFLAGNQISEDYREWARVMLFKVWFGNAHCVLPDAIKGAYSARALAGLRESKVVVDDGSALIWRPKPLDALPEVLKAPVAEALLGILCDPKLRRQHDLDVDTPMAQHMVDAMIFGEGHWRRISGNRHAAEIMAKATLPTEVLSIVGDRMLELSLGVGLGL